MVIGLMLLVTTVIFIINTNMAQRYRQGVGIADEDEAGSYDSISAVIKVLAVLGTPFLFALKPVGFILPHRFSLL